MPPLGFLHGSRVNAPVIPHSCPWTTPQDGQVAQAALETGMLAHGVRVRRIEEDLGEHFPDADVELVSSGSAGLVLALRCVGVVAGDEVIVPTYVCRDVARAVEFLGAQAVFADVGSDWCLDPTDVRQRIGPRTRAIVAVHTFGILSDVESLKANGLPVVEDCAHGFGLGPLQPYGNRGDVAVLSFQSTKFLSSGEGGAVIVRSPRARAALRGWRGNDNPFRCSDWTAALLATQLGRFEEIHAARVRLSEKFFQALPAKVTDPLRQTTSVFFRFPLTVENMDFPRAQAAGLARGIAVRRGVDDLLHRVAGHDDAGYPGACRAFASTLSFPFYPALTESQLARVLEAAPGILQEAVGG